MRLRVGRLAPDTALGSGDGGTVSLSNLWRDKPLVVAFLRHFG